MELRKKIIHALNEIRPFLAADGGDISLVEVLDEKIVKVKLHGNCAGCSVNQMTLKTGVEMTIKKHAPEIEKVVNVENCFNVEKCFNVEMFVFNVGNWVNVKHIGNKCQH